MIYRKLKSTYDQGVIANALFNDLTGAQKSLIVGPSLKPIFNGTVFTTNLTAPTVVKGLLLAIYNNSNSLHTITFGDQTVTALSPGATDALGRVGIPCPPNQWTYLSPGHYTHAITSNPALLVFAIEDE